MPLRALIASLDAKETVPQIELACGDTITALVLRHMEDLNDADKHRLRDFAAAHPGLQWWLQPGGLETVALLDSDVPALSYALPEFGVVMPFKPTDFTQVNPHINQVLVSRALRLLDVQRHERVIDWFCGLGNFTLPLATRALLWQGAAVNITAGKDSRERGRGRCCLPGMSKLRPLLALSLVLACGGSADKPLRDFHVLVTAGPTFEPIDPVRFIGNRSSGKQGYAIAAAAARLGARVTLIAGPGALTDPPGVHVVHTETASKMLEAVEGALPADIAIFSAAVAGWRAASMGWSPR